MLKEAERKGEPREGGEEINDRDGAAGRALRPERKGCMEGEELEAEAEEYVNEGMGVEGREEGADAGEEGRETVGRECVSRRPEKGEAGRRGGLGEPA